MTDEENITCPKCGSNNWKLFKNVYPDGYISFSVRCSDCERIDNTCFVEKDMNSFDVIKTAFELIEDDRNGGLHKIVTQEDILVLIDYLTNDETRLRGLKFFNDISDYGRGELSIIEDIKGKLGRLSGIHD